MLIKIKSDFWIDFEEVRLIIPNPSGGLNVYYKGTTDYTIVPKEDESKFLNCCRYYNGANEAL